MDLNVSTIVGRLLGNPTLKSYKKNDGSEGFRCFFRVAVTRLMDRGQKDRTKRRMNAIPVVAWGEAAKRHAQYLAKGTEVSIRGELICESQKQEDGSYRDFFYLQADDVQYGRPSQKNATPQDLARQADALQKRISELAAGTPAGEPATETPAAAPAATHAENPFA